MCSDNKTEVGHIEPSNVHGVVLESARTLGIDPSVVDRVVALSIQVYSKHVIAQMISRLLEPGVIQAMGPMDIVNCITKLLKLIPNDIAKPIVEDLKNKLVASVDLSELSNQDQSNQLTNQSETSQSE